MEFYQMRYVLTAADELSFSKAAERLCVTQPAMSKQIKAIEKELGIEIFRRKAGKMELTALGRELIEQMKPVYSSYEELMSWVGEKSTERKRLKIGVGLFGNEFIKEGIDRFNRRYPNTEIEFVSADSMKLQDMIRLGIIDFAVADIIDRKSIRIGLNIFHLCERCLFAVVSKEHGLAGDRAVLVESMLDEEIIIGSENSVIRFEVMNMFREVGRQPKINIVPDFDEHVKRIKDGAVAISKSKIMFYARQGFEIIPIEPRRMVEYAIISTEDRKISQEEYFLFDMIKDSVNAKMDKIWSRNYL